MARKYERQYQDTRERIKRHAEGGEFEYAQSQYKELQAFEDPDDAERILEMADAYDEDKITVQPPDGQSTKAATTLKNYLSGLKKVAPHVALADTTATELNTVMQAFHDGTAHNVKDEGLTKGAIRGYQNALRQFYYCHEDLGIDPDDITLFNVENKGVDPADMLTREEIQAIRDAADCTRDRALFDFLIYTGQRNTATRSIRIKDLDLENDRFRLNPDADGLKGAEKNGKWRDLLLSAATIRQYLNTEHPAPEDGGAYLFTSRPKYGGPNPHTMLDVTTIGSIVGRLADRAAEEVPSIKSKPTHPHALRHNFVTIALRRGVPESAIKHQIGHAPESSVMESTYAHLKDSDHIRETRKAFDLETEEHESELTPEVCPKCGESPPKDSRLCPWCGLAFTPDTTELNSAEKETTESAEADDLELAQKIATAMREKPEAFDEILEEIHTEENESAKTN